MLVRSSVSVAVLAAVMFLLAVGSASAVTVTFDNAGLGEFTDYTEAGYNLHWIGYGDHQAIADVEDNCMLVDSEPTDGDGCRDMAHPHGWPRVHPGGDPGGELRECRRLIPYMDERLRQE